MIKLKIQLANSTHISDVEIAPHIKDTETLTLFMNQEVVVHPETLQWTEAKQPFEIAERDNEEDENGDAGGFLPYDEFGVLVRDLPFEEQLQHTYDDSYWQVSEIAWEGETGFEEFVATWMNESQDAYKDLLTNGCQSGMVSELVYHYQVISCIKAHKRELEGIVQEIADEFGDMGFLFGKCEWNPKDFSFDRLVWMCFEETVKTALHTLQLEDV